MLSSLAYGPVPKDVSMGKFALLVDGKIVEISRLDNIRYLVKDTGQVIFPSSIKALGSNRTILLCYKLSMKK